MGSGDAGGRADQAERRLGQGGGARECGAGRAGLASCPAAAGGRQSRAAVAARGGALPLSTRPHPRRGGRGASSQVSSVMHPSHPYRLSEMVRSPGVQLRRMTNTAGGSGEGQGWGRGAAAGECEPAGCTQPRSRAPRGPRAPPASAGRSTARAAGMAGHARGSLQRGSWAAAGAALAAWQGQPMPGGEGGGALTCDGDP